MDREIKNFLFYCPHRLTGMSLPVNLPHMKYNTASTTLIRTPDQIHQCIEDFDSVGITATFRLVTLPAESSPCAVIELGGIDRQTAAKIGTGLGYGRLDCRSKMPSRECITQEQVDKLVEILRKQSSCQPRAYAPVPLNQGKP
tara:strand:+ start:1205 stop:1633 length:429 start_codon:yes stop_codon:yes gene_type:complete